MAQTYTLLVQKNLESASNISHVHESVSVQNCADENELASRLVEFEVNLLLKQRMLAKQKDAQKALERIANESYGICETCGEEIALPRLLANPTTLLCISCQEEYEQEQRMLAH